MSNTKHTPGPWRVSNHVGTIDGRQVECAPDLGMFDACIMTTNNEGRLVAIAGERGSKLNPYDYLPVGESSANMHLIAAAPRLLAIVERIEGIADSEIDCPFCGVIGDRDHRRDCLVNEARAAIAAAKATT